MAQRWFSSPWSSDPYPSFEQLRHEMDEVFDRAGARTTCRTGAYPPVNLYETLDDYVLTAELPGVGAGDIDLSIERNRVTLRGGRQIEHPSDASLHRVERQGGRFRRSIELPAEVDGAKAEAAHRNGVLVLRIPKAEAHKPRRIEVKTL
jgi:HSP20 family protein